MKNFKKIFFVLIAFGLILQSSGSGYLFAESLDEELPLTEEVIPNDDNNLDDEKSNRKAEAILGDFILSFKDYKEEQAQEAYVITGKGTTGVVTYNLIG